MSCSCTGFLHDTSCSDQNPINPFGRIRDPDVRDIVRLMAEAYVALRDSERIASRPRLIPNIPPVTPKLEDCGRLGRALAALDESDQVNYGGIPARTRLLKEVIDAARERVRHDGVVLGESSNEQPAASPR